MIIHDIEQGSEEWHSLRAGLPTASKASSLVTSTGDPSKSLNAYADEQAAYAFTGEPLDDWQGNAYTERGHEIEPEARAWYQYNTDLDVVETGFITDDLVRYGCSPDGMIKSENGLVEIKCLPKNHLPALLYWHKNRKPPTNYLAQCRMQMLVCNADWCDLVYYHTKLPKLIIRIERDNKLDEALLSQIAAFHVRKKETIKILKEMAQEK